MTGILRNNGVLAAAIALAGALLSWLWLDGVAVFGIDDANISHVYARNLASGLGPVYYPGGPAVEGSTSTLWTLVNTLLWSLFGGWPPAFVATCLALCGVSVWLGLRALRMVQDATGTQWQPAGLVVAAIFLSVPTFFSWNVWSLMDITLWTVVLTAATVQLAFLVALPQPTLRAAIVSGVLQVLTVACRPEGVAIAAGQLVLALGVIALLAPADPFRLRKAVLVASGGLAALAAFALMTAGRVAIFGYPLPNTYYAKVSSNWGERLADGLAYCLEAARDMPALVIGALAWAVLLAACLMKRDTDPAGRTRALGATVMLCSPVLGLVATTILSGGDHFREQRFFQPLLPLLAAGIAGAISLAAAGPVTRRPLIPRMLAAGAMAALVVTAVSQWTRKPHIGFEFFIANYGREIGTRFNALAPEGEALSVGVITAGGFALTYARGPVLDLMGLNWPEMAHSPQPKVGFKNHAGFDPEIFWRAGPDIVLSLARADGREGRVRVHYVEDLVLKGLLRSDRFRAAYQPFRLGEGPTAIHSFGRRAWLASTSAPGISALDWSGVDIERGFEGPADNEAIEPAANEIAISR